MDEEETWTAVDDAVSEYAELAREGLRERWELWQIDLSKNEMYEVIGALLARQVTLVTELAGAPSIWNGHSAPLFLRSMTDNYITMAWIFKDPVGRSRKFILHGLGQEKLMIEHRKAQMERDGVEVASDPVVESQEAWLNSQRFSFLTEVDVGSWSGLNARKMAEEAECLDLYQHAYTPFSSATHNMWPHVSRYNLDVCENPLHRYHKVPIDPALQIDPDYLFRGAKYVQKAFNLFDRETGVAPKAPSAYKRLKERFKEIQDSIPQ